MVIEINSIEDLDNIRNNLSGDYILMRNLDFNNPNSYDDPNNMGNYAEGWLPIGWIPYIYKNFEGIFDGQGHSISNLYGTGLYQGAKKIVGLGLFGMITGKVKNLTLSNVNISVYRIGGIFAYQIKLGGLIENCHSTGRIEVGSDGVYGNGGGIAAYNYGNTINCHSSAEVITRYRGDSGGIIGENRGTVIECSFSGSVTEKEFEGNALIGGIVGDNSYGNVEKSYSTGNINGTDDFAGGAIGRSYAGNILNSYATGNVRCNNRAGGFIGEVAGGCVISNSYSIGVVAGITQVGGFVGRVDNGIINNCYWDIETSGMTTSAGGTGKTTAEMKNIQIYLDAGWDIVAISNHNYIWNIVDGKTYPFLSWEIEEGFLDITGVTAPAVAHTGDLINFIVHTKNTSATDKFKVELSGDLIASQEFSLGPGLTQDVPFSFTMPTTDISIIIKTYHQTEEGDWVWDATSVWGVNKWN